MNWQDVAAAIACAVSVLAFLHSVFGPRSKATRDRIFGVEQRVDRVEDRMTKVEGELKHVPDKSAVHGLELRVMELSGNITALTEKIKPISHMADRVQQAIIEKVAST
jgi:hypothetical protein